ncbi:ribokinase [Gordonia sp. NPDC003424]
MTHTPIEVAVVGTLNLDIVIHVERMPNPGETVMGRPRTERPGGRGANQALAAAAVARTALIGVVGDDDAADRMLDAQRAGGVDVTHVRRTEGISGQAIIEVDETGANRIIVLSGANATQTAAEVSSALEAIDPRIVVTQLESPVEVTRSVAEWCCRADRRLVLNPSPVTELDAVILAAADPLIVNEHEAAFYGSGDSDDPEGHARGLLEKSRSAVITLGGEGVITASEQGIARIGVRRVEAVDTTGAGDLFAGTVAGYLARGADLVSACRHAAIAATDLVTQERD